MSLHGVDHGPHLAR